MIWPGMMVVVMMMVVVVVVVMMVMEMCSLVDPATGEGGMTLVFGSD